MSRDDLVIRNLNHLGSCELLHEGGCSEVTNPQECALATIEPLVERYRLRLSQT